jgi:hypothetical protein
MKIIIIILLLLNIKYSQLTTLFNCTFNYGLVDDCIFSTLLPSGSLQINVDEALNANTIDPPDRPLSDATSVCM